MSIDTSNPLKAVDPSDVVKAAADIANAQLGNVAVLGNGVERSVVMQESAKDNTAGAYVPSIDKTGVTITRPFKQGTGGGNEHIGQPATPASQYKQAVGGGGWYIGHPSQY